MRDETAKPVSQDQILRDERGQGYIELPFSADDVQDWQPYPVGPSLAIFDDHTYKVFYQLSSSSRMSSQIYITTQRRLLWS